MGRAMEWLGPEGCRAVAMDLLTAPKMKSERASEIWAHCPFHAESTPGGAFSYNYVQDVAMCLSCGETCDLIGVFNAVRGREIDDGEGFMEFRKTYAPDADLGQRAPRINHRKRVSAPQWAPRRLGDPAEQWSEHAALFVEHSVQRLAEAPDVIEQLEGWGIDLDTARKCRIGWNDRDKFPPVTSWGLPYAKGRTGKEAKIYLPAGLVIPYMPGGRVVKLKIRRSAPDAEPRYWHVKGGYSGFHIYGRPEWRVWVIIETERDAAMVWRFVRHMHIGTMATGSASARPDDRAEAILRNAQCILNAGDFDQAGRKNAGWWEQEFPQCMRWPAPPTLGKDVGDAAGRLDVAAWVYAGLPSHVRRGIERSAKVPSAPSAAADVASAPLPQGVRELQDLLEQSAGKVSIVKHKDGGLEIQCPNGWKMTPEGWELSRKVSELVFFGPDEVIEWIDANPRGRISA